MNRIFTEYNRAKYEKREEAQDVFYNRGIMYRS